MTKSPRPRYRMIGTTDDVIECGRCGRPELKLTVVLAHLDHEGNDLETVYYGTSCAARALADRGIRTTPAKLRDEALRAQAAREAAATYALERLELYGIPLEGEIPAAAAEQYRTNNRVAFANNPHLDPAAAFLEHVARWRTEAAA